MGKHTSGTRRGRLSSPVAVLSALLVVALVGWFSFDLLRDKLGTAGCDSPTTINVATAPDLVGVVTRAGKVVSERAGDDCYHVAVTARESAAVAESLVLSEGGEPPDVWIPESTMWLQRAQDRGAWSVPVTGTSIASSPVVFALTEDVAGQLGWPAAAPTWGALIGPAATARVTLGFADPARDPVAVSTLLGVRALTTTATDPGQAYATAMRALSPNTVPESAELFTRLPGGTGKGEPLSAFPTSENALLRHNAKAPDTGRLVAAYPDPAVPPLDYPYIVLPGTDDTRRSAGERFLGELIGEETQSWLADAGFRNPQGKALRPRGEDKRTAAADVAVVALPAATEVGTMLNEWAGINLSGRIKVLLDVSGSMNEQVPGTGKTRMAVTVEAAELGLRLFKPTTKVGLWLFSTNLNGDLPYREVLPMQPVIEHLTGTGLQVLRDVVNRVGGNTGLYDSVLAAYQDSAANWEPGRINVVVVLTDGKNDNRSGITRDTMLAELAKLQDPRHPLQIIGIGIGPDVDPTELQQIASAAGGQAYTTADPTKIVDVFYAGLSKLLCQPPACKSPTG